MGKYWRGACNDKGCGAICCVLQQIRILQQFVNRLNRVRGISWSRLFPKLRGVVASPDSSPIYRGNAGDATLTGEYL